MDMNISIYSMWRCYEVTRVTTCVQQDLCDYLTPVATLYAVPY